MRFLWVSYVLLWFSIFYFFIFSGKARRASMMYLDRVTPGRSWWRRRVDTYRHMRAFGSLLLDRGVMLTSRRHGFHISGEGLEHLAAAGDDPNGVVLLTAHFGNAEIGAPYIREMGLKRPVNLVMYRNEADGTERFHATHHRLLADMKVISTTDPLSAGLKIIAALRRGEMVAMRADRKMDGKTVGAELLGGQVELPSGPFVAAVLSGAPVLSVYTVRLGYRTYRCFMSPARRYTVGEGETRDEVIGRAAKDFAGDLEKMLRRFPLQWSNFYDFWEAGGEPRRHDDTT